MVVRRPMYPSPKQIIFGDMNSHPPLKQMTSLLKAPLRFEDINEPQNVILLQKDK